MAVTQGVPYNVTPTVPMTVLDLDAAGLDPSLPAPAEFVQFLYDNSRSGYLTLWSSRLGEPDAAARITKWIANALDVYHARSLQTQMAPVGDKPEGSNVTEVMYSGSTTPDAPICIDVPALTGTGAVGETLSATMGNWGNEPQTYAYAFSGSGTANGNNYTVVEGDAGTQVTCIVTATNAGGSTAAPPSNAIAVAGAAAAAAAAPQSAPDRTGAQERSVPRDPPPPHQTTREEPPKRK